MPACPVQMPTCRPSTLHDVPRWRTSRTRRPKDWFCSRWGILPCSVMLAPRTAPRQLCYTQGPGMPPELNSPQPSHPSAVLLFSCTLRRKNQSDRRTATQSLEVQWPETSTSQPRQQWLLNFKGGFSFHGTPSHQSSDQDSQEYSRRSKGKNGDREDQVLRR